jgi:RNA polymerase sigma factor (TIGR02999 family)
MNEGTQATSHIDDFGGVAADDLLPLVYRELRALAAVRMARESSDNTLQATALVHEAYLRLFGLDQIRWDSRGHFFAAASEAMRRILVEHARRKRGPRRGGDRMRIAADLDGLASPQDAPDVLAVDDALRELAERDPPVAKLVELKYFGGLTLKEAAATLGVSSRTADNYWAYAKAWLHQSIEASREA